MESVDRQPDWVTVTGDGSSQHIAVFMDDFILSMEDWKVNIPYSSFSA